MSLRTGSIRAVIACFTVASLSGLAVPAVAAQQNGAATTAKEAPQTDTSFIDANGTAHVTRVVPVPTTISPEAQKILARPASDAATPNDLAARRKGTDEWQARAGEESRTLYPANVASDTIAGVPVKIVTPLAIADGKKDRVLINVHGGGFNSDSGSLTETVPIANLTGTKVVAVLYRLAPEHPFPAAVDDAIAVYKEMLKTYQPRKIGLYGTSAGAILTAEVAVRLKQLGLPLPGAMGVFSGMGDFSQLGDSQAMYALNGLSGHLEPPSDKLHDLEYSAHTNLRDPVLSPMFADLAGMPPTLFVTSGRDLLLSGTTLLHRAFLRAGDDPQLVVFEALPHAFWNNPALPESKEFDHMVAAWFDKNLAK